jgi:hypothetical protein
MMTELVIVLAGAYLFWGAACHYSDKQCDTPAKSPTLPAFSFWYSESLYWNFRLTTAL